MDGSADPASGLHGKLKFLEGENEHLRMKVAALEQAAGIDGAEIKRLKRLLVEATYGAKARKERPLDTDRAADRM